MKRFNSILDRTSGMLRYLGAIALTLMMLLTVVDVIGRFFKHPIFGSVELVGFLAVIVAAAALPHTYKIDGHVGVEIVTRMLPKRISLWVSLLTSILSLCLFSVIAWQMFIYAEDIQAAGEVSMNLEFPIHYIVYILAAGLTVFSVTILQHLIDTVKKLRNTALK